VIVPVGTEHEGSVTVTNGTAGDPGNATISIKSDEAEMHPASLVTVKLYVPIGSPEMVLLDPVPVIDPGLMVQLPVGKPLSTTLPVGTVQVG
jgi:hypothetical protein